jgi:3-oxoacyl-[acyl-carrier-protein] synthase-3
MTDADWKGSFMRRATITGWGTCVPPAVLTNADLEQAIDTTDDWITTRTGIKERRISHVETSEMGAVAGAHALAAAGLEPTDIDLILVATCSPDRLIPAAAAFLQHRLGAVNAAVMDLNAACSGFVYSLNVASSMISAGTAQRVLLVGVEKLSAYLDLEDRSTAVLFGDGAGAVVLEPATGDEGVLSTNWGSDGSLAQALTVEASGTEEHEAGARRAVVMDGKEIFRNAVVMMGEAAARSVEDAGLKLTDVDVLIPHQANTRIIDATARRMDLPLEKVFSNIASYGNTSAASIPIALAEALAEGRIRPGDIVTFVAFGGGLTWGAATLRWGSRVTPIGTSDAAIGPPTESAIDLVRRRQHSSP